MFLKKLVCADIKGWGSIPAIDFANFRGQPINLLNGFCFRSVALQAEAF